MKLGASPSRDAALEMLRGVKADAEELAERCNRLISALETDARIEVVSHERDSLTLRLVIPWEGGT